MLSLSRPPRGGTSREPTGGQARGRRRAFDWSAGGLWVAVLIYVATQEQLDLPTWGLVALAALATTGLVLASRRRRRPIECAIKRIRRALQAQARELSIETAIRSCEDAATALMALLPAPDVSTGHRWFDLPRMLEDRQTLSRYRETTRQLCVDAVASSQALIPVSASIAGLAEQPRNVRDLYSLLLWLTTAPDQLRADRVRAPTLA